MSAVMEKADDLGGALGRTDEYQALKRAMTRANDDRELVEERNALIELESHFQTELQAGRQPEAEKTQEYEERANRLQANASYQGLVAAQENFDKLMAKVNQQIATGMEKSAESRIILPT